MANMVTAAADILEAFDRLFGFRVRLGEHVYQAGSFACVACGAREQFAFGETACDCKYDTDQSEWLWSEPYHRDRAHQRDRL